MNRSELIAALIKINVDACNGTLADWLTNGTKQEVERYMRLGDVNYKSWTEYCGSESPTPLEVLSAYYEAHTYEWLLESYEAE